MKYTLAVFLLLGRFITLPNSNYFGFSAFGLLAYSLFYTFSYRDLVNQAVDLLSRLPDLCSPSGALSILPSILWLLIGEYKLISTDQNSENYLSLILIFIKSKIRSHQVFKPRRRCKRLN